MSEEDIQILLDQSNITRELAKKIIIHHRGDLVECLLELDKCNDLELLEKNIDSKKNVVKNDDIEAEVDTNKRENLIDYRNTVDQKDTIYNYKAKKKEEQKKKNKLREERIAEGKSIEDLQDKKICNETLYYSTRKDNNVNNIKVL